MGLENVPECRNGWMSANKFNNPYLVTGKKISGTRGAAV